MLADLGLRPLLNLEDVFGGRHRRGPGMSLLEAGLKIYRELATFAEAGVSDQD